MLASSSTVLLVQKDDTLGGMEARRTRRKLAKVRRKKSLERKRSQKEDGRS